MTPIYDALKKFAKLYSVGSKIIRCDYESKDVAAIARKTKTGYEAVVANVSGGEQEVEIKLGKTKKSLKLLPLEIKKGAF